MYGVLGDKVIIGSSNVLFNCGCQYVTKYEALAYRKAFDNITDYTTDYAKRLEKKVFANFPGYVPGIFIKRRMKIQEFNTLENYDSEYAKKLEEEIWGKGYGYVKGHYIDQRKKSS